MRTFASAASFLAAAAIFGCEPSTQPQPDQPDYGRALPFSSNPAAKPEIDPTYANGRTVYMIGPRLIPDARATMPGLYEKAEELYLVVYPQATTPTPQSGPITLPSGYQPQCNPCFHPGVPPDFAFHDHVITGAPGWGTQGTAGEFLAPWKIVLLVYNPAYVASPDFAPLTSEADIDAAEAAGNVFLPINAGGDNPYEFEPGSVLICPIVSSHA